MWAMIAAVATGGAAGSVMRYLFTTQLVRAGGPDFPWATLAVNVLGALLIGLFARLFAGDVNPVTRAALTVGFCGGFTTFSTYSVELVLLIEQGRVLRALLYAISSTALSVVATVAGLALGSRMMR